MTKESGFWRSCCNNVWEIRTRGKKKKTEKDCYPHWLPAFLSYINLLQFINFDKPSTIFGFVCLFQQKQVNKQWQKDKTKPSLEFIPDHLHPTYSYPGPEFPFSLDNKLLPRPKSSSPLWTTSDRPITSHTWQFQ